MPTGYTAKIADGIDFKTFALDCARAFSACILLRDEPGGGEAIPDAFEPSSYHAKAIDDARQELRCVEAMTDAECERESMAQWERGERARIDREVERNKLQAAYEAMLAQVDSWTAPTADHVGLKRFMREQLETSIEFDCGYSTNQAPKLSGAEWRANEIERASSTITYHTKHHADEVRRAAERTAWVKALRESLARGCAGEE